MNKLIRQSETREVVLGDILGADQPKLRKVPSRNQSQNNQSLGFRHHILDIKNNAAPQSEHKKKQASVIESLEISSSGDDIQQINDIEVNCEE